MQRIGPEESARVLSIDIRAQRIGYVVFEGPTRLLDWGGMRLQPSRRRTHSVDFLLKTFQPTVLVLRKRAQGSARDSPMARRATRIIRRKATSMSVPSILISNALTARLFREYVKPTKSEIAGLIAACFPDLAWRLPPRRKVWNPEDWNMSLFDSAALGLAYFARWVDADTVAQLLKNPESFRRPVSVAQPDHGPPL